MSDLIDRQAAIDELTRFTTPHDNGDGTMTVGVLSKSSITDILNDLPSAQPEPCEDAVSRQAVYNVLDKMPVRGFKKDGETIHGLISLSQVNSAIINLPSAQLYDDMIHLQKEQAYMQGWEDGRTALREEIWERERD